MTPLATLANMDAIEWLQHAPNECVDLVLTDPAYESLEKHRAVGTTTRLKQSAASSNAWFSIFPNSRFPEFLQHVYRVLRPDRHFYLMCDCETSYIVKPIAERVGFRFWKDLIWDKTTIGMGYHYRARYEKVLFFEKGKRQLNDFGVPDVLQFPRVRNGYPTEKPVELLEVLIAQSTQPGEVVVDPFFGSGATGVAAVRQGRSFAGCDLSQNAVLHAVQRIEQVGGAVTVSHWDAAM